MKHRTTIFLTAALLTYVALFAYEASAQGIRESVFDGAALDTFWVFKDPKGDCTLTVSGGTAQIVVPGPNAHEPVAFAQDGNRAPRIIQRISAPGVDHGNFDVNAKFNGIQNRQYQMQGILAIQDDKNLVRCELYSDTLGLNFLLFTFGNDGGYSDQIAGNIAGLPAGTTPLYVRLRREDTVFTQYYSTDGATWIQTASAAHQMYVDSIGVYAANGDSAAFASNTSPSFTGIVDFFKNTVIVPIQLSSFTAVLQGNSSVRLNWTTATETNNFGFEIQKSIGNTQNFQTITNSFIPGHGTTLEPRQYSYVDFTTPGSWFYRLKQIDLDGTIHYTEPIQITLLTGVEEKSIPTSFAVHQNYPNPFNPSTLIKYELPTEGRVSLEVFTILGQKVATLTDEIKPAGFHAQSFNAEGLTSGVYLYKLSAAGFSFTRTMLLIK